MSDMKRAFDLSMGVLNKQVFDPPEESDYTQNDLLYCGKCDTPRQMWLDVLDDRMLVQIPCECRAAELDRKEAADRQRKHQEKLEKRRASGVADRKWHECTFAKDDRQDAETSDKCMRYAENFDEMLRSDTGLLLYGGVGTGKTFLAACIANALVDAGKYVLMVNLPSLIAAMNADYGAQREYYNDKITRAHLLILDDFGVERDTEFSIEQVYEIINARYKTGKPLIVTTNLSMQQLRDEPLIGRRRIYDRLIEKCVPLMVKGESRRKAIAADKREAALKILEGK